MRNTRTTVLGSSRHVYYLNFMIVFYIILAYLVITEIVAMIWRGNKTWGTHAFESSGCNVFNNANRFPYCVEHDKDYRRGGWALARLKADWKLFKSLFLHDNPFLAILMFVSVRFGSMWAFQYGKKRKLYYPDGTTDL